MKESLLYLKLLSKSIRASIKKEGLGSRKVYAFDITRGAESAGARHLRDTT